jgi:tRNA A-37 threonylcarbamoyl transferase component Bud32
MVDPSRAADLPPTRRESLDATPSAFAGEQSTSPVSNRPPAESQAAGPGFGHYELLEQIACGGMGIVYKARDLVLGRVVALKMIRSGVLAQPEEVQRFYREAQAAAQLSHANIVPIHEVGEHAGRHYFTMAFAPGGSLGQERGPATDPYRAAAQVEKVARAVQYAHDRGILHRDLKPANVLLDEHGEPLVADFGLAKFLDSDLELTHSGQVLGTPAYMAPEQAPGGGGVTRQSDIWALGVLLYELLTGERPFAAGGREALWDAIRTADPEPPRSLRPDLDRGLETIILKCLEKDPARRYGAAGELADDLARWQRGEPILARPEPWPGRAGRALRRHPRLVAALVLLGFVAGGTSLFLYLSDPERALRSAQARLARGDPATLVPGTGPPPWCAVRCGQESTKVSTEPDRPFTVYAWELGLVELLRDPQRARFLYRAEVQSNADPETGQAGIYFGYSRHPAAAGARGVDHSFVALWLGGASDGQGATRSRVRLDLRDFHEPKPFDDRPANCLDKMFPGPAGPNAEAPWHRLAVEVAPEATRAFCDEHFLGEVSQAMVLQQTREITHRMTGPDLSFTPDFRPRQPLGLLVRYGTVSFRNVVVEPLPAP